MVEQKKLRGLLTKERQSIADLRNMNMREFGDLWEEQKERCALVETSDYYHYRPDNPKDREDQPYIDGRTIASFYHNLSGVAKMFIKSQNYLLDQGRQLLDANAISLEEMAVRGRSFLEHSYNMAAGFLAFNSSPVTMPQFSSILSEVQRMALKRTIDNIGDERDENFRETLRRYMPRWMHFPVAVPKQHLDASDEVVQRLWSYDARGADWLVSDDKKIPSGMPIHMVFKTASMIEEAGNADVGYLIRTYGITEVLQMEKERSEQGEKREIPFFRYILPALLMRQMVAPQANQYFDFQRAVQETMIQTFSRIQNPEGRDFLAENFLQKLHDYYADIFPQMIARSIISHSQATDTIDQQAVFRGLRSIKSEWYERALQQVLDMSERRLLTVGEIEANVGIFVKYLEDDDFTMEDFMDDIKSVAGSEDSYSFRVPLARLLIDEKEVKGEVEIDLDTNSEAIDVVLRLRNGRNVRFLPFQLNFSGEIESLCLDTLEGEPISEKAALVYRNLAARCIQVEAERVREKQTKFNSQLKIELPQIHYRAQSLTRAERIELYDKQKRQQSPEARIKKRDRISPAVKAKSTEDGTAAEEPKMRIVGMEIDKVEKLLRDGGVKGVEAEQIIKKLERALNTAEINGYYLGKKISREVAQADSIDLRQISWKLFGIALRIYIQGIGEGVFMLRGLYKKETTEKQTSFIRGLIKQITKENSAVSEYSSLTGYPPI